MNPYYCYAFSFVMALFTYLLGWSYLYPKLSFSLVSFLLITIVIHLLFGIRMAKSLKIIFRPIRTENYLNPILITVILYLLWGWEFIYEGGIPIIKILLKQPYNYRVFGIPSFHVGLVTFSSFYTIYLFYLYLSSRKKILLFLFFINLLAALIIYNRSMFLFNISASLLLFIFWLNKIPSSFYYFIPVAFIIGLYFFGIMGNIRGSSEAKVDYTSKLFLRSGKAKKEFVESDIPKEFFWAYIYISSPLANLQTNINTFYPKHITASSFLQFFNNEILMDFISKRLNTWFGIEPEKDFTIKGPFNVSTIYSRSYCYLGWLGIMLMALIVLVVPWIYMKTLPVDSPFFLPGLAILSTSFLFMAFDNTLRFTGLSFQLMYPIILHVSVRRFPKLAEIWCTPS